MNQFKFTAAWQQIAMEPKSTFEFTNKVRIVHTLDDSNVKMLEEIEETTVTSQSSGKLIQKIVLHKRQIGDKSLVVKTDSVNGVEVTSLPSEEMQVFNEEWLKIWKPRATNDEIMRVLENNEGRDV